MTEEQYWGSSDYKIFWAYRVKYEIELEYNAKKERNLHNFSSWLGGLYIRSAISDSLGGGNNYPDLPFDFDEMDRRNAMSEEERIEEERKLNEQISRDRKKEIARMLKEKRGD